MCEHALLLSVHFSFRQSTDGNEDKLVVLVFVFLISSASLFPRLLFIDTT